MLTPLVSSTGGAFTNVYPASDVLCHRPGTVSETSGSHYPLANFDRHSLARALFRSCIDPCDQNRAHAERFKNSAAHDPEHLPSYQRRARFYPFARYHPLGCPREAGDTAYPFTRPLCRDAPSRAPRFRSSYAERARAFRQASHSTKDTSGRRLQSHMSKTSTRCLARLPSRLPELPLVRCDECCGSRRRHSLRSALPPVQRAFSALRSSGAPSPLMPPSPPELRWLIRPARP